LRIVVSLAALAVAALIVLGLGALLAGATPAAPKHPFGVGIREAAQSGSGFGHWLLTQQEWFYRQMADALKAARGQHGFALGMILLAFAYGVFHAGGPGHGKAVISAYLIANERALRRGIVLSAAAALLQALVAIAIVLLATFILRATALQMTQLTSRVEIASFAAIMLFGLVLTWRKAAPVALRLAGLGSEEADPLPESRASGSGHQVHGPDQAHDHQHGQDHDHADHGHDHDDHAGCNHHVPVQIVAAESFRWKDAVPVVVAAGSRPCSGAIIVLVFALSQGLAAAGLVAVFAMAAGVAITVGALAVLSVFAKRVAQGFAGGEARFKLVGSVIELLAASLVATFGFGLMTGVAMIGAG
jgi:ABC-type nickel/cobalt efflux system permease component RcnA